MVVDPTSEFFKAMRGGGPGDQHAAVRRSEEVAVPGFWNTALAACALMLVVEGLLPFLSPATWRHVFERATRMSDGQIRFIGLASMLAGLAMLLAFWP